MPQKFSLLLLHDTVQSQCGHAKWCSKDSVDKAFGWQGLGSQSRDSTRHPPETSIVSSTLRIRLTKSLNLVSCLIQTGEVWWSWLCPHPEEHCPQDEGEGDSPRDDPVDPCGQPKEVANIYINNYTLHYNSVILLAFIVIWGIERNRRQDLRWGCIKACSASHSYLWLKVTSLVFSWNFIFIFLSSVLQTSTKCNVIPYKMHGRSQTIPP